MTAMKSGSADIQVGVFATVANDAKAKEITDVVKKTFPGMSV